MPNFITIRKVFLSLALLLFAASVSAQFRMEVNRRHATEIPFEFRGNFIVVEIMFNKVFPLKFILDTGAEHTILIKREYADILDIPYRKRFSIMGSDMETMIFANLVAGVHLDLKGVVSTSHSLLVLEDDYFKFEELIGTEIHGIIGADLLRYFTLKIDYNKKIITFINPRHFKRPSKKFREYPIEIRRNKPYIIAPVTLDNGRVVETKLLVDTGASLALLLNTNTHPDLELPENVIVGNIGTGLGGFLEGFMGRVKSYELAGFQIENVIVNFQDVSKTRSDSTITNSRNGILGNTILSRFILITDYQNKRIFVKPIKRWKRKKFQYDKSGLIIVAGGRNFDSFTVSSVLENSPAGDVDIRKGDVIKSVNGIPSPLLGLQNILSHFQRREGKRIKLTILRGEEKLKKRFRLRELI